MQHTPKRILITGGAGFIGSNLVRTTLADPAVERVVVLDALTYAGHMASLAGVEEAHPRRFGFVHGDIRDGRLVADLLAAERIDTLIHLAAESHVDRSIEAPLVFVETNVVGTAVLLHAARQAWGTRTDVRFHQVSTDEVFGSLGPDGAFSEATAYDPSSPYSASKAGADHLVRAWHRTYHLPATLSNCSNNYGPFQHPEKLIPHMITNALAGRPLPVYGAGANVRDWLYVEDHCEAILRIVREGEPGETYCVGGASERRNLEVVECLCDLLQERAPAARPYRNLITFVADRPGHDQRYAIDAGKLSAHLGWAPRESFESGLRRTVDWYLANRAWCDTVVAPDQQGQRRGLLG